MNNEWQYHVVKGISWLVCRLPYKLILLIGASLGPLYGVIAKKQKLRGIKNIKIGGHPEGSGWPPILLSFLYIIYRKETRGFE